MGAGDGEQIMLESNGGEEKILVSVRLRPLNEKEKARNDVSDWECINQNTVIYRNPLQTLERSLYPTAYTFDRVFRCDCSTREVYEEGAKEVALSVVSGINSSVFAYGQTSSGKTYTMCGVTEYTVADIYDYMERHKEREFLLKFSALEIYNESVRDLLGADSTPLRLLDDPERGTVVEKLREETLRDWNHFKVLLSICEAQRQIGDTSLNETSSRSHQILRLTVESSTREFSGNNNSSILTATVNFVDLAGSERASQALSAGARLKEGCHINRSLLTLGTVIRKLSKGRTGHIPFRDSKLTRILQSTLSGNARTAIICTISPARSHVEQSRNTLLFGSCAKEVTTNAQVNVLMSDKALVKHLQGELARLEGALRTQGPTSAVFDSAALLREKDLEIEELKKEIKEATLQREQLILLQEHLTLQQEQLTLQRDLAQSQLKDFLCIVGTDRHSGGASEHDDNQYPQLRVRRNVWEPETPSTEMPSCDVWDPETPAPKMPACHVWEPETPMPQMPACHVWEPETPVTESPAHTEFQRPYLSVRSFDASQYSDGHSRSNSEDNYLQFSDMDDSFQRDDSTSPSSSFPIYVEEDLCKEVKCIETEDPSESGYTDSSLSHPDQNMAIPVVARIQDGEEVNQELGSPSLESEEKLKHINPVSVTESSDTLFTRRVENGEEVKQEPESPSMKDEEKSEHINPISVTESSDKLFLPLLVEKGMSGSRSKKISKSRSCKELSISSSPSYWFEREENNESTPPCGLEQVLTGKPDIESLKRNDSPISVNDLTAQNMETSRCCKCSNNNIPVTMTEEVSELKENQIADDEVQEGKQKSSKDVGSDPIVDESESVSKWDSECGKMQREIFELWNECSVPLVHRAYFFLQLKGNPKESIYMEVELKRLSILKESFSQGNQNAEQAESIKDLRQERQWLSKLMKKKFSELYRQTLYLNWGIGLNTKDRRLQLAHRLWTDTEDMGHIVESANIVKKLAGEARPEPAFKEMFGLYFASPRRSTSWKFY